MPIQYRCRCGQEVILRQRESVYLVVALILALTLVNTVFAVLLWNRLGDLEARPPTRVVSAPEKTASDERDAAANTRAVVPVVKEPVVPEPVPELTTQRTATTEARSTVVVESTVELMRPENLDTLSICQLLNEALDDSVESQAVRIAATAWTRGEVRSRAADELRAGGLGSLSQALSAAQGDIVTIDTARHPRFASLLHSLASDWPGIWSRLLPVQSPPTWLAHARAALVKPTDNVVVVDLSESMNEELPEIMAALSRFVSLTDGHHRWGWIGYRDDVIQTHALTADFDEFTGSLAEAWQCQDGGDVPEGVDRALFAGLRFGAFEWNPNSRHRFLVVGDAPPPYERIEPMLSLVEAAASSPEKHQVHCLGILREEEFRTVPGFAELARASSGTTLFVDEGEPVAGALWQLITGSEACRWEDRPAGYLR